MALDTSKVLLPQGSSHRHHQAPGIPAPSPHCPRANPSSFLDKGLHGLHRQFRSRGRRRRRAEVQLRGNPHPGRRQALPRCRPPPAFSNELQCALTTTPNWRSSAKSPSGRQAAAAMGRVLDYVVYHAFDPKKKTTLEGFTRARQKARPRAGYRRSRRRHRQPAEAVSDEYDITWHRPVQRPWRTSYARSAFLSTGQRFLPEIPIKSSGRQLDGYPGRQCPARSTAGLSPRRPASRLPRRLPPHHGHGARHLSEIIEYGDPTTPAGPQGRQPDRLPHRGHVLLRDLDPKGHRRAQEFHILRQGEQVMAAPLTQTLVVQEHDEADETGLSIPVRLVKPDGTPVRGRRRNHRMVGHRRQASPTPPRRPPARRRDQQQAAEAQLAASADSAAIVAKVNSMLTKLKAAGLLA